jgi:hypothetical protein
VEDLSLLAKSQGAIELQKFDPQLSIICRHSMEDDSEISPKRHEEARSRVLRFPQNSQQN